LINTKLKKYENFIVFYIYLIVPYNYKIVEDEINYIMKTKGPVMKIMLLNEIVKHLLFKPNFDIRIFFYSF